VPEDARKLPEEINASLSLKNKVKGRNQPLVEQFTDLLLTNETTGKGWQL